MSDLDLVMRWVRGWVHIHSFRMDELDGWPLVHVGRPSRETEIVCVDPGRRVFDVLARRTAHDPRAMLTVFGTDLTEYRRSALPLGLRIDRDDEVFMAATLTPASVPEPDGFTTRWAEDGTRATYYVEADDSVAAEGTVGVLETEAVMDAVETAPRHRRRGLARHVMAELTQWAIDQGATTGLLAASSDGAALYTTLGWETRLAMLSLMGQE